MFPIGSKRTKEEQEEQQARIWRTRQGIQEGCRKKDIRECRDCKGYERTRREEDRVKGASMARV